MKTTISGEKRLTENKVKNPICEFRITAYGSAYGDEEYITDDKVTKLIDDLNSNVPYTTSILISGQVQNTNVMIQLLELLKTNSTVETVEFRGGSLREEGVKKLTEVLEVNTTITKCILGAVEINGANMDAFARALQLNTTLKHLDLNVVNPEAIEDNTKNNIEDAEIVKLVKALQPNNTLEHLSITSSTVGDMAAEELGKLLKIDRTLKKLDLHTNIISSKGAIEIAGGLKGNTTLESLDIGYNEIENEGGRALVDALKLNSTLKEIRYLYNPVSITQWYRDMEEIVLGRKVLGVEEKDNENEVVLKDDDEKEAETDGSLAHANAELDTELDTEVVGELGESDSDVL